VNDINVVRDTQDVLNRPPRGYFVVIPQTTREDAINVAALVRALARSWWLLLASMILGAGIAVVVALLLRNTFRAETLIMPVAQSGSGLGGAVSQQLGGLASLAGLDLSEGGGQKDEYLATLNSVGFARDFITSQNLMPIFFSDRWDAAHQHWLPGRRPPTLDEAVKKLNDSVRTIDVDRKTGVVSVSMEWYSPQLAADWANRTVDMVNERLRTQAIDNANRSIQYLNNELSKATAVALQQAIYRLIEEQINDAMLSNVQRDYAFHIIDRAVAPDLKSGPKRTAITIIGAFVGLLLGLAIVFVRHMVRDSRGVTAPTG